MQPLARSLSWSLCFVVVLPVVAQEAVELEYKYHPGEVIRYSGTMSGTGVVRTEGLPPKPGQTEPQSVEMPMDMDMDMAMKMAIVGITPKQDYQVELSMDEMKMTTFVRGHRTEVTMSPEGMDTKIDGKAPPQEQQGKVPSMKDFPFVGKPMKMTITRKGKPVKVDIENAEQLQQMGMAFDFNKMIEQSQPQLPEGPIRPGDKWEQAFPIPLPQGGDAPPAKMTYEFVGMKTINHRQCANLKIGGDMELTDFPVPAGTNAPAGMKFEQMTMSFDGNMYFDVAAGRMVQQVMNIGMQMQMSMTIKDKQGAEHQMTTHMDMDMGTEFSLVEPNTTRIGG